MMQTPCDDCGQPIRDKDRLLAGYTICEVCEDEAERFDEVIDIAMCDPSRVDYVKYEKPNGVVGLRLDVKCT